ncbi:VWA domain-containing protein [Streptomyces sp. NBC_00878]|uniref:VWA domain-containing protein n=1 Tax=Streptomyces sp. NBC_00878 TaxID=2975854 RepID=UPI00225061FC|nr:VWA domain-containing protein [Streptomyces sp. NBC_00878]MCX4904124.1 VWA domain-containing protein [Streptomyces sp. NBC_00878]
MPNDENVRGSGQLTILYLGSPSVGDDATDETVARLEAEARHRAAAFRLRLLTRTARTESEADALLVEHPDAALMVHPGEEPPVPRPEADAALWNLLRTGAVLRRCDAGSVPADGGERPRPPSSGSLPAFLVVDLMGRATSGLRRSRRDRRREADCRAFAAARGLDVLGVLTGDHATWDAAGLATTGNPRWSRPPFYIVVHPDITAPDPDTPDGLLWRWLGQGRTIHSGRPGFWGPGRAATEAPGGEGLAALRHPEGFRIGETLGLSMPEAGSELSSPPPPASTLPGAPPRASLGGGAVGRGIVGSAAAGRGRKATGTDARELRKTGNRISNGTFPGNVIQAGSIGSLSFHATPGGPLRPPRDTTQPLPHDGLFIRRNNAFGTRSALGVKDLIEQGVIVGQEQIRFDDFVAARTDQVPGPGAGEAIAVSHGLAAVQGEFKANEATTHFVEITLKAGDAHPVDSATAEPLPVNFVFVVDVSISMEGEKLDSVRAALRAIHGELRPADCLGIITFNHGVRTVLSAVAKKDLSPSQFADVVDGLTAEGGTDINRGVQFGIDEIGRNSVDGRTVNCLYLFSDGDPTSGERDWITIRTNIAAKLRGDLTLSCFGFGSDARMPELAALAGLAGGHAAFVTHPGQVTADLLGDLSRRDHLAAIDIQLKLDIDPAVEIRHLYGHDLVTDPRARAAVLREARQAGEQAREDYGAEPLPDIVTEEKGIRIFAPDLAFEETYWVVLEVRVPPGRELSGLGTATVQYVDTVARESRRHEIDLSAAHTLAEETVTVHAVGLWTSEVTFYALDDLYDRDRDAATNRLTHHIKILKAAHSSVPAKEFRDDQVTLRKLITLAGTLGSAVSFSDISHGSGFASATTAMNDFGRVRSGFWPRY